MKITLIIFFLLFSILAESQVWKPIGQGFITPNNVITLEEYNNKLYAGGGIIGSGTNLFRGIGTFDGINWTDVGGSTTFGAPHCMTIFNGELIAAGFFPHMGNVPNTRSIASWDGNSWHPLQNGITSGTVYAMAVYNNELYIGGNFTQVNNQSIIDIAKWNGTNWLPVCPISLGLSLIWAMEVYNNELYIAGFFYSVDGNPIYNIAKFDGTTWSDVGGGFNTGVFRLFTDTVGNRLFAAGNFSSANFGSIPCPSNVAYWDGNIWNAIGPNGPGLTPRSVFVYNNDILAGNSQANAVNSAGDSLYYLLHWNGVDWVNYGGPTNGTVMDMIKFNNELAVCGAFTEIGDTSANLVASYGNLTTEVLNLEHKQDFKLFPNPLKKGQLVFIPNLYLQYLPFNIQIINVEGKEVFNKIINNKEISLQDIKEPGNYFYEIRDLTGRFINSNKIIIID